MEPNLSEAARTATPPAASGSPTCWAGRPSHSHVPWTPAASKTGSQPAPPPLQEGRVPEPPELLDRRAKQAKCQSLLDRHRQSSLAKESFRPCRRSHLPRKLRRQVLHLGIMLVRPQNSARHLPTSPTMCRRPESFQRSRPTVSSTGTWSERAGKAKPGPGNPAPQRKVQGHGPKGSGHRPTPRRKGPSRRGSSCYFVIVGLHFYVHLNSMRRLGFLVELRLQKELQSARSTMVVKPCTLRSRLGGSSSTTSCSSGSAAGSGSGGYTGSSACSVSAGCRRGTSNTCSGL